MESFRPVQMPKFKSPQEEIDFLRAQVAQKENALAEAGLEVNREKIATDTLNAYKEKTPKEVLHSSVQMPPKEVEALALRLTPETHDRIMEELLGTLLDQGIKNTLSIVNHMDNPHVDDDFHRFLVQYLQSTHGIPGLKESTELYRALDCTLFEISLPEVTDDKKKGLKELLAMMEQFYAGMHSVGMSRQNEERNQTRESSLLFMLQFRRIEQTFLKNNCLRFILTQESLRLSMTIISSSMVAIRQ